MITMVFGGLIILGCQNNRKENTKINPENQGIVLERVSPENIYLEYQLTKKTAKAVSIRYSFRNQSDKSQYVIVASCEGFSPYIVLDETKFKLNSFVCDQSWMVTYTIHPGEVYCEEIELLRLDDSQIDSLSFGINAIFVKNSLELEKCKEQNGYVEIIPSHNSKTDVIMGKKSNTLICK